jgi:hypothetical protein
MFSEQSLDSFVYLTETACPRRVSLRPGAHPLFYGSRDALRDRSLARMSDLITRVRLIEAEAVAERNRILLHFCSGSVCYLSWHLALSRVGRARGHPFVCSVVTGRAALHSCS